MKVPVASILAALLLAGCVQERPHASGVLLTGADLRPVRGGMQGEEAWGADVRLGPGHTRRFAAEVTAKGNGLLRIRGQEYRIFDAHDDGEVFDPPLLDVRLVDLDGDGYKDLLLRGTLVTTAGEDRRPGRATFREAYRYAPSSGRFEPLASE